MDLVVAPFDQRYPFAGEEVSVKIVPGQTSKDPLCVITGVIGDEDAFTIKGAEVPLHVPLTEVTE